MNQNERKYDPGYIGKGNRDDWNEDGVHYLDVNRQARREHDRLFGKRRPKVPIVITDEPSPGLIPRGEA